MRDLTLTAAQLAVLGAYCDMPGLIDRDPATFADRMLLEQRGYLEPFGDGLRLTLEGVRQVVLWRDPIS